MIKRFEFDLRFKYNDGVFLINNKKDLNFLYKLTTEVFKISTNSAYVSYLLEDIADLSIHVIFIIDLTKRYSDVINASIIQKPMKYYYIPDYIKSYFD